MLWAIWYHLYNSKKVINTHGGVLLLVKSLKSATSLKVTLLHGCFSQNGTKSRKASHIDLDKCDNPEFNLDSPTLSKEKRERIMGVRRG